MTTIEWTHPPGFKGETWNPVTGCTKVSAGCKNCYAEKKVFPRVYPGRKFTDIRTHHDRLAKPLQWKEPRCVFVNSLSDLFHEQLPDEFIDRVFAVMALAPRHRFIVLTKRPERMRGYCNGISNGRTRAARLGRAFDPFADVTGSGPDHNMIVESARWWPLKNVILGISVEDQDTYNQRAGSLMCTPAALRIVSYEPALGPVNFRLNDRGVPHDVLGSPLGRCGDYCDELAGVHVDHNTRIEQVICGGESGAAARPFERVWADLAHAQCARAGVAFFMKQMGAYVVDRNDAGFEGEDPHAWPHPVDVESLTAAAWQGDPARVHLRYRKGSNPDEWPESLRVRQWPEIFSVRRAHDGD